MSRPDPSEYFEYYRGYVGKVPDGDILETLERQRDEFLRLISGIGDAAARYRYAPGKWSVKEVIGHVIDCERVFGGRALAFGRNDATPMPSFDQDAYVAGAHFDERPVESLAEEFDHLRRSLLALFRSFDDATWMRWGTASGYRVTVRAIAWIIAGHLDHHAGVLTERYGVGEQRPETR